MFYYGYYKLCFWRRQVKSSVFDLDPGHQINIFLLHKNSLGGSVGCAIRLETRRSRVQPPPRSATLEIDHEIFSTVILSLPLIQEGQLSVSGERMCTKLVNCLED